MLGRWIRFFIAIALGIAAGLGYGWLLATGEEVNTTPENLRIDYRSDAVLMIAEAYHKDQNLANAIRKLTMLGTRQPANIVQEAVLFAERQGYHDQDLQLMRELLAAVQALSPIVGTPAP